MALFELNSDITIGKFRFNGVNEVQIKRSLYNISDTAIIRIPSIAKITANDKVIAEEIITGKQFADGDPVIIKLGYNGALQTEFSGFVKRRDLNMPLEIECEGYSWLLRRNTITQFKNSMTLKELLNIATSKIDTNYKINVQCDIDMNLGNVVINNKSGFDIINDISKYTDGCMSCFFIQPDTLWCGMIYTPYANGNDVFGLGTINYQLGYNVVKNNSLKERLSENDPVQVKYSKKLSNGDKLSRTSDVYKDFVSTRNKILNHLQDVASLKLLADEKAYQLNYSGYEGNINAFLQPYAAPGYKANITDDRYYERNGMYVIDGIHVTFGINGARRIVEIGPKVGFANE